mgnify:CR=1 FL=1
MRRDARVRFDLARHLYTDPATGEVLPHITGMLEDTGWIDSTWYDAQGAARGTAVHALTKDYDLGMRALNSDWDRYRGYVVAHIAAMDRLQPTWTEIEEAHIHPTLRFGGRPDRVGTISGRRSIVDEKTGTPRKADAIQTALQAILISSVYDLPPRYWVRQAWYLRRNGKPKIVPFDNPHDITIAEGIVKECCR